MSYRENGGQNPELAGVVHKNIASILEMRRAEERKKRPQEKFGDLLTKFFGSMLFVYVHVLWFGSWIVLNTGMLGTEPFDPYPFSFLTLVVSLEAIFLSTFVLISQNHAGKMAEKRAELDLQINMLAEHEITRLLHFVDAIADHLGVDAEEKPEVEELKKDVGPDQVLSELETREEMESSKK